jgi:hypothetical protein
MLFTNVTIVDLTIWILHLLQAVRDDSDHQVDLNDTSHV